ncbi:MAG: LOG family protein [Acidobacteriota bacterium]
MGRKERVAVFGRSDVRSDEPLYSRAVQVGNLLARGGFVVVNGGYSGTMEAVSLGAREAGGLVEGVLCRQFAGRDPNPYLTRQIWADDLFDRTRELMDRAEAFIALEPRMGTLSEVTFLLALWRAGHRVPSPLVLMGDAWENLQSALESNGVLEEGARPFVKLTRSAGDAVEWLKDKLTEGNHGTERKASA